MCRSDGKFNCVGIGEVDEVRLVIVRWKVHVQSFTCDGELEELGFDEGFYTVRVRNEGGKTVTILEVWL